jgi:hypothetical protein
MPLFGANGRPENASPDTLNPLTTWALLDLKIVTTLFYTHLPQCSETVLRCLGFTERSTMAKKIDPLNKKHYGAVSAMLAVSDVKAAVAFYQKAFGFAKRGVMNGPDGKPIHAELTLRGTTLMLGPENPARGMRSANSPWCKFGFVSRKCW